jgi:regulator of chromosome condensation
LGLGDTQPQLFPKKLESLPSMDCIDCGTNFCLAVSKEKDLYSWGFGEMLQLGNAEEKDEKIPFKVNLKDRKVIMACGGGQHSVILLRPRE